MHGPTKPSADAATAKVQLRGVVDNVGNPVTNLATGPTPHWQLRTTWRRTSGVGLSQFRCFGGPNQGSICASDSECPGGFGCAGQGTAADDVFSQVVEVIEGSIKSRVDLSLPGSAEFVKLEIVDEEGNTLAVPGLP
jgi:hypothetical protein